MFLLRAKFSFLKPKFPVDSPLKVRAYHQAERKTRRIYNMKKTAITYFPMLLLSGATIPVEVFPEWFQSIAKLLPLGVGIDLLKSISAGCYDTMTVPVIILVAIAAVCSAIAAAAFRWE